jgi:hypothetical protein
MDVLMADEKKPGKQKSAKPEYTTFRIFAEDGEDLSDLADKEDKTIAELYRELCAPLIRKRLIQKTREHLKKLEGEPPAGGSR